MITWERQSIMKRKKMKSDHWKVFKSLPWQLKQGFEDFPMITFHFLVGKIHLEREETDQTKI